MSVEDQIEMAERLRATTPTLAELQAALTEPVLTPWPPPPLDPLPEPRPIPGTNLAVIDGLRDHPPQKMTHQSTNSQHIAPDRPHNLDVVGDEAGRSPRKDRTRGKPN